MAQNEKPVEDSLSKANLRKEDSDVNDFPRRRYFNPILILEIRSRGE